MFAEASVVLRGAAPQLVGTKWHQLRGTQHPTLASLYSVKLLSGSGFRRHIWIEEPLLMGFIDQESTLSAK